RVVDQGAHLAEAVRKLRDHLPDRVGVAHVERGDVHRHLRRQFFLQGLQAIDAAAGEYQRPAAGGEAARGGTAEAGGGAGDEDDTIHGEFLPFHCDVGGGAARRPALPAAVSARSATSQSSLISATSSSVDTPSGGSRTAP